MHSSYISPLFLAPALFCMASAFAQAPQYTVHDLGTRGGNGITVNGIGTNGQVVGCFSSPQHAFRSAPNAAPDPATDDLGTLGGATSCAYAINASGQVAGSSLAADGNTHAFRTDANAAINAATDDIGTLGLYPTNAYGINDSGQVVGSSLHNTGEALHAFRTAPNSSINPVTDEIAALLPNGFSAAKSVNAAGNIQGDFLCANVCNYDQAFVYANGTVTTGIDIFFPFQSYTGINDQDQIAFNTGGTQIFSWQNGTVTQLADGKSLGFRSSAATAINNSVQLVGIAGPPGFAFLSTHGAVYDLKR
jgi:probable HAF family extracellular repeat protein